MVEQDVDQPIHYALGQPRQRTGIGGLSMKATVVLAVGFGAFLLLMMAGQSVLAFSLLPVTALVMALLLVEIGNRSLAEAAQIMVQDVRRRRRGEHVYVSGQFSRVPGGHRRLPGMLARTSLEVGVDSLGREFCVVVDRPRNEATVLLDCNLTGQTAMTQAERNQMTAEWSRWLSQLSLSGDVRQMVVVVASRPGTGELVSREVESIIHPECPEIARVVMMEAARTIAIARPEVDAHIAITVHMDREQLESGTMMEQLGARVPAWAGGLQWSGIMAEPMTRDAAIARVHQFFNPASERDFEESSLSGQSHGLAWEDAGPAVAVCETGFYDHDGCRSVTWEMKEAPRSTFEDTLLTGLVTPHWRIERKRVALVYRPYEAGKGAAQVEAEHQDALVAANSSKKITSAKAELRLEHTEAARRAQARGAQLGRYSLFVTATVSDKEQMGAVSHDVEQLAAGASIRLQVMRHQQDAGFVTTCGCGQTPWGHESTSSLTAA